MESDASARELRAGDLRAVFLPQRGMLGASLQLRGEELLGRVEDIETFARQGRTCGIPLLYPWANRLSGLEYRTAEKNVTLDAASPLLHFDNGLPMHGVAWSQLAWDVLESNETNIRARLAWTRADLLAVFPFLHQVEMRATLNENALTLETKIFADTSPVPISFGFHPYFKFPDTPRADWRVTFPAMTHLELDARQIPNGQTTPFAAFDGALGARAFDDGFALDAERARFALQDNGRRITVEFLEGYPFAQIYAPRDKDYLAIEPMTAPTNALVSGKNLRVLNAGETLTATFRIAVETIESLH